MHFILTRVHSAYIHIHSAMHALTLCLPNTHSLIHIHTHALRTRTQCVCECAYVCRATVCTCEYVRRSCLCLYISHTNIYMHFTRHDLHTHTLTTHIHDAPHIHTHSFTHAVIYTCVFHTFTCASHMSMHSPYTYTHTSKHIRSKLTHALTHHTPVCV